MTQREVEILEAAIGVFLKYGVQRSSMSDIAREAAVARQTLYNTFSNKDEVLRAAIRLFSERSHRQIEAELSEELDLKQKLDIVFEHSVIAPFKRLKESPHAADFIEGCNQVAQEEILLQDERTRVVIEKVLRPYGKQLGQHHVSPKQLSDFVQRSSSATKHTASSDKHLRTLLNTLVTLVLQAAGVSHGA